MKFFFSGFLYLQNSFIIKDLEVDFKGKGKTSSDYDRLNNSKSHLI